MFKSVSHNDNHDDMTVVTKLLLSFNHVFLLGFSRQLFVDEARYELY